jgi:predicted nucleic acid-binding protein
LIDIVLDASVVLKWFAPPSKRKIDEAREIRRSYGVGETIITVPSLLFLELLNVAGRRWGWNEEALTQFASALGELEFEIGEAELASIAFWTARGLTAYDAAYVALAEARGVPLVTDDDTILSLAPNVATTLGS